MLIAMNYIERASLEDFNMRTIIVKTQKEFDEIPKPFIEFTSIEIRSKSTIAVRAYYEDSRVVAYEDSRVVAYGNSRVESYENSRVEAYGDSRVEACGNSRVEAYGDSRVEAYGDSRVEACGDSRVVAYGNSRVVAYENSRVVAYGNSRVEAYGDSRVEAYGDSRVVAYGNSRVEAYGDSRVEAYGDSRVVAYGSSRVVACELSSVFIYSKFVAIERAEDNCHILYRANDCPLPLKYSPTTKITKYCELVTPTFEEWLDRGYVVADGIRKKLINKSEKYGVTVYEVEEFLESTSSFVVQRGNTFSHGKTIEEAIESLRYKISDRDTTKFLSWSKKEPKTLDEMIEAYRCITGACEYGTRQFVESMSNKKDTYTPQEVIILTTKSNAYGAEDFKNFKWKD